ncbi:alanine--tRNA ligase, partial [bacterium]|nr:alanine--tRNA ligase [bacterium]
LASEVRVVNGVQFLAVEMPGINPKTLRSTVDKLKEQLGSAVILLATVNEGKVALACGVTDDLTSRFKAGDIIRQTAVLLGGKGGGRPDFAQGGGTEVEKLPEALDLIFSDIATKDIGR